MKTMKNGFESLAILMVLLASLSGASAFAVESSSTVNCTAQTVRTADNSADDLGEAGQPVNSSGTATEGS